MWVTVSLVDLWREILCDLHRDRGQEVVCIGKLRVRALDESGLPTLHQDEAEAGCCRKREVDQEVFEGEDVGLNGLKDRDLLDAPDISNLPVALGTIRVCVVATDANGPHGDRSSDADLPVEDRARDLHDRLFGLLAQGRDGVLLEAVEGVGLTPVEGQV